MRSTIIFDLDGVLADFCEIHRRAFREALNDAGYAVWKAEAELEGRPTLVKLRELGIPTAMHTDICRRKQRLTLEAIAEYDDGGRASRLVWDLIERGINVGIYSNSVQETIDVFLDRAGLLGAGLVTVSNEDVLKPKPDPEGYFTAMRLMETDPTRTLIVEDSLVGLKAACATGARVLPTTYKTLTLEEILSCCNS